MGRIINLGKLIGCVQEGVRLRAGGSIILGNKPNLDGLNAASISGRPGLLAIMCLAKPTELGGMDAMANRIVV